MKYNNLIIEKKEYVLLKRYINFSKHYTDDTLRKSVLKLAGELESAKICDEADMPVDVIRFNSTITVASETAWRLKFKLVEPKDSDVRNNKISILTPMGLAVIGYAEGDRLLWEFPSGEQDLTVEKVEQENKAIPLNKVL